MTFSPACQMLAEASEGCRLVAYPDPGSGGAPYTIGYGHTGPDVHCGLIWTMGQARQALVDDLAKAAATIAALTRTARTTQGQFDALTDFVFNVGTGALRTSVLLKKHLAGDYPAAAAEFDRWTYAGGRKLPGLVTRRAREKALYLSHQEIAA